MLAAPNMRLLRSLHLCKTLRHLSSQNPNPCLKFPKRYNSGFAAAGEFAWSGLPGESSAQQTPAVQTVFDPVSGRLVTKHDSKGGKGTEPDVDEDNFTSTTQVGSRVYGDVIGNGIGVKRPGKSRSVYVCENCGYSDGQWWGMCRQCQKTGSMKRLTLEGAAGEKASRIRLRENVTRSSWLPRETVTQNPVKSSDVCSQIDELKWRITLPGPSGAEMERVLGGGIVPGSLILVGGDPGVGKSTLLLQVAALIAKGNAIAGDPPNRVIYVSGEESVEQIGNRASRLGLDSDELFLHASTDVEDILEQTKRLSAKALIVDSIQTMYLQGVPGSAGGVPQVKECSAALLRFAKNTGIPVLLIGHVTKAGDIAGPRVLEHIVDVVLYMEGDKCLSHRLLRSVKNRFGSTDELGIFRMTQSGLEGVSNPSEIFLSEQHSDSDYLAGLAVTVIIDGSRAFLIEIQALCIAGSPSYMHANGIQNSRAAMLISVIRKQARLNLQDNAIFLNVVSGVTLTETAGDLAMAAAICSSFLEFPIPKGIAFIAEVGLAGELRGVPQMEKRVNTLAKLGYKKAIVPKSAQKALLELKIEGIEILGCKNLKEMIYAVFNT
ncbi:uncharacterized protein LOC127257016 [Andrographis paniculata]|uniref:uncharacterized protein LOC127257016 n=1 Tax=Andrographis paniculata TaxID=175694 RepID=UPI0021E8FC0A|nr:uncharacterized protein LOC127257016 [Andrographis paniculata]